MPLEPLIDAQTIASHLRVKPRTVMDKLSKRPDFPKPVNTKPTLWRERDVEEWLRKAAA